MSVTPSSDAADGWTRHAQDDTLEIGFAEDGVFWLTQTPGVPDAAAAEGYLGTGWRVAAQVWLGPTGAMANHKDEAWEECHADRPGARPGWRLVLTTEPEIFVDGEWASDKPISRAD